MTESYRNAQLQFAALGAVALLAGALAAGCDIGLVEGFDEIHSDYPICSSAAVDPDRDGWGWEPAHSCRMPGSGHTDAAYPLCTASATDPDGDGWGWDPAQSCRMVDDGDDGRDDEVGDPQTSCAYVDGSCSRSGGDCRVFDDNGARAGVKAEIWNTMLELNAGRPVAEARCRADLAVAMAMQEAHSFTVDGYGNLPYDWTKDGRTDGAQNVCVFNMNIDFIKRSCRRDCARFQSFYDQNEKKYLNRREYLPECVRRLNEGFDHFGIDGTLHFHRGGSSGWEYPGSDERAFARAEKVVADHLRDNPAARADGSRIAHSIDHR